MRQNGFKHFSILLTVVCFLLLAGFGCKGMSAEEKQATKTVSLEYWTVYDDVDEMESLIKKYTATKPFLTVNVKQIREGEVYSRLVEALAEDKGPDIISIRNKWVREYQSKLDPMPASVKDVNVYVTKGKLGTQTTVQSLTQTMPGATQVDKEYVQAVKNDVVISNQVYGLPLSFDNLVVYYNKDILDKAGVATAPKDWVEFQKAVIKITKIDKTDNKKILQSGAAIGLGSNVVGFEDILFVLFEQSGLDFVNKSGTPYFNSVASGEGGSEETSAMKVLDFYTDYANPSRNVYAWNKDMGTAFDSFIYGTTAFFFGYNYHNATIKSRAPQLNFDVLPLFQLDSTKPVNAANYWVQSVVSKTKYRDEAWGLVNYLTHSKANKDYLTATDRPAALRVYVSEQSNDTDLAPFVSQALIAESWYKGKSYDAAVKALSDMIDDWLKTPPDENKEMEWRQGILNSAVSKVGQTM